MWRKLFSGPWPDEANLLPPPVQQQALEQVKAYFITRGWQLVLGEVVLWAVVTYQKIDYAPVYGGLAIVITLAYAASFFAQYTLVWLTLTLGLFLAQGMLVNGLGAVTSLSFLVPYTIAGMLLSGQDRFFIQMCSILAFWFSLIYEAVPFVPQLHPPNAYIVSFNILLAAYVFQTMRYLNHLAVAINTAHVADEVQQRSQQFLARVSHELRTPLNSVLGFAKLLKRADLTETQTGYLHQIIEESEQLNRLVSDLLDSAHLATGKLSLTLDDCDVNTICQAIAEEQRPNIPSDVVFQAQLADDLPIIQADAVRLRQAISNLVANAIKYTTVGEILLKTYQREAHIYIEVRDSGIGISEAQQQLIFVPFVQLDNRKLGVGLGLDIALQLVRLHGGDIHLHSTPNQGSTFTIELPVAAASPTSSSA